MSTNHRGNTQPSISQEEHEAAVMPPTKRVLNYGYDGTQKNLFFVDDQGVSRSIVTIASNINTTLSGNITLNPSPNQIGSVTISHPITATFGGNVTLNPSPSFIGLTTTVIGSSPTLFAVVNTGAAGTQNSLTTLLNSDAFIGLATVVNANQPALTTGSAFIGLVTVANTVPVTGTFWQATQPVSIGGNVTLNPSPNYIGLVTIANTVPVTGTFYQATQPISFTGNVTLNPSPNFIGLVTTYHGGGNISLNASSAYIGLVTIANSSLPVTQSGTWNAGINSNITLNPSSSYIGLVTVGHNISGNVTLNSSNAWIGLATTVNATSTAWIGLATVKPDFGGDVTIFTGIYSAAGAATIFVAPASNRFFLRSLHLSSLGRSEVEVRSGATTLIPFTSLATTGGYIHDWDSPGLPSRSQADALVLNLNSATTVSVMASTQFRA